MIRIKTICIKEFRGIRNLSLDLTSRNFGICGPNGTGKSGVVDAIEFCLTGDVTRLSGSGTTGLTVKSHAPHVDFREQPEKAKVTITAAIPSLGKDVTISRSVKNSKKSEIEPPDEDVKAVVEILQVHPEFALSRREIVKYIITPPGRRSEDVQTLLRLNNIETFRKSLKKFANSCKNEVNAAKRARGQAMDEFHDALGLAEPSPDQILQKINEKRQILSLPDLTELSSDISYKNGEASSDKESESPAFAKEIALADLEVLVVDAARVEPSDLKEHRRVTYDALAMLQEDNKALTLARQHGFITTGLDLVTDDGACPLCDTPWEADALREHLQKKLLDAEEIRTTLNQLKTSINELLNSLESRITNVEKVEEYCSYLKFSALRTELNAYLNDLNTRRAALKEFLEDHAKTEQASKAVNSSWWQLPASLQPQIDNCFKAVKELPDISETNAARDFLTVLQDRHERVNRSQMTLKTKGKKNFIAQKILEHFNQASTATLEGIYSQVAEDFSKYYRTINHEDEDKFVGKLVSEPAKLTLDVDFYGRGVFPPGAYHSEGHQDGMGLCLYLALMKHTLGNKFTFAVLDDVLMSVDTGHRRDVCRLLKTEFPNTQFILTTHDRVWLQYMKTERLIQKSQTFGGWNVDSGPRVWDDQDIWTEIEEELDKNNVAKAAWLMRHYLEYISTILADNLRVHIEFRSDARHDLGDLLPTILKTWRKRIKKGIDAAKRWGMQHKYEELNNKYTDLKPSLLDPIQSNGLLTHLFISMNGLILKSQSSRLSFKLSRIYSSICAVYSLNVGGTPMSYHARAPQKPYAVAVGKLTSI